MELRDVEHPARAQQLAYDFSPPIEIRQPVKGTHSGVDHIEPPVTDRCGGLIDIGADPIDQQTATPGERLGYIERWLRKVSIRLSVRLGGVT